MVIPAPALEWLQQELVKSDQKEQVVREQALRRDNRELERLQARLDLLYEDRLDGRISAAEYDQKAGATREQQQRLRHKLLSLRDTALAPAGQAADLMALASKTATCFCSKRGISNANSCASWCRRRYGRRESCGCPSGSHLSNYDYRTGQLVAISMTWVAMEEILISGGEGGIRTHGTRKGSTVFETARFNHSRTSPCSYPTISQRVANTVTRLISCLDRAVPLLCPYFHQIAARHSSLPPGSYGVSHGGLDVTPLSTPLPARLGWRDVRAASTLPEPRRSTRLPPTTR